MNAQQFESVSSWEMSDIWNFLLAFGEKKIVFTLFWASESESGKLRAFQPSLCAWVPLFVCFCGLHEKILSCCEVIPSTFFLFCIWNLDSMRYDFFSSQCCQHSIFRRRLCEIWMSITAACSHSFIGLFIYSTLLLLLWCHLTT